MAPVDPETYQASVADDTHAKLLYNSLEKYDKEKKKGRRPSVILAALVCLFLSATGGLALAIELIAHPIQIEATCLPRDLILFASCMSLLYTGLHIRGARKDYVRNGPAPPQNYGNYLHASALLISRLSIAVWIASMIATAVVISKAIHFEGFGGKVPFLDLLICIGALPSFIIISITIEKHTTPFATTAISRTSFLTCRVSEFADDLVEDMSVSRRASIQRKQSENGSILTLPTEEIFRLGQPQPNEAQVAPINEKADDRTELMANSPVRATHQIPPMPKLPGMHSPPEPTYNPGGWRNSWNDSAEEVGNGGAPYARDNSSSEGASPTQTQSSRYSSHSGAPLRPAPQPKKTYSFKSKSSAGLGLGRRSRVSASTSIASSSHRSNLSTVRYAAQPEIAIRQPIKVVRNPAYMPPTVADEEEEEVDERQMHQPKGPRPLKRNPSNFSRPIPAPYAAHLRDSGVDIRVSGSFTDDATKR